MTENELKTFDDMLSSAEVYLEFGAGHSTKRASLFPNIKRIDCVESDQELIDKYILSEEYIRLKVEAERLFVHKVDIGETKAWGYPKDGSSRIKWVNYSEIVHAIGQKWDTVLVDGRFRVACVLNVLLLGNENCRILIHDFWNRNHYHVVLNYLDVICSVDSLGIFRKREHCNDAELKNLIDQYKFIPE